MKRIIYILLLAIGMVTMAPVATLVEDSAVSAMYAQQDARAKARAKAQKEREKAKAKRAKEQAKAKAKKAKEQAKKKKAQAKAKAKKDKQRAMAQQQKSKAAAAKATTTRTSSSAPAMTAAEEKAIYMEQVAGIEKANAKAEAYNTRDIAHRLGFWGQVGYSNLFTSGIAYDEAAGKGFQNIDKGFVGGGLGLGYQLRYKQMLMTIGAEFQMYNSYMGIANNENGTLNLSYGMNPYADKMIYSYRFAPMNDKLIGGFVQLPILFGMELKNTPLFWQAGVKVGMGLLGKSTIAGTYSTSIADKELIDDLENMYTHTLVTDQALERSATSVKFGLNVAATAEIGVNLDQWVKSAAKMRLSLFADYGFLNVLKYEKAQGAQDIPAQMLVANNPLDFPTNSALATTSAADAKVNPFIVGAKLAVWFDLPRKQKEMQDLPKAPTPRMGVLLYNEQDQAPLGGVAVEIVNQETGKTISKNTNRKGLLQGRFPAGQYRITATKNGYYPSDTVLQSVELFTFDTLKLALKRIPEPIIYTLCMNVYDAETKEPVEAMARMTALTDSVVLYEAQAADDGFIETPLREGNYIAHMTAQGYMPKDDTIHFVQDTTDIYMTRIKEGIKVKIENLFFATNKTHILPQSEQAMADLAQFLLENAGVTIHIVGHTDNVGSNYDNQILSEGRANAVRADLIQRGIDASRITAEGKGETEPVADNDTDEGRQLNRRVEFTITATGGKDIEQVF
ncbi:MAG: OmpA family protein [Paludibacteraceae bacterium]|nr:OmpA family protein [Paludibacteraceae bacterium]